MTIYTGTSGYSYKEWKGIFYPEKLPANKMLAFYATELPAVEINNTFYRLPKASVLELWRSQVPEGFRFIIKAPRRITHIKRLKDAEDETAYLFDTLKSLQGSLGVVLFQLPPFLRKDLERLENFLNILPAGSRAAFEFRHQTWYDDEVYALLRQRNAALCLADSGGEHDAPHEATADWGYLRLRREDYSDKDLSGWMKFINAQGWQNTYAFFKHEDAGAGPRMAKAFLERFA